MAAKGKPNTKILVYTKDPEARQYSYLKLIKARRRRTIIGLSAIGVAATLAIAISIDRNQSWQMRLAPLVMICAPALLLRPSEEWQYHPWEGKPRRFEKFMFD